MLEKNGQTSGSGAVERFHFVLGVIGFAAPVITFLLAVSSLSQSAKLTGLGLIAAFSLGVCIYSYWKMKGVPAAAKPEPYLRTSSITSTAVRPLPGAATELEFQLLLDFQLSECRRRAGDRELTLLAVKVDAAEGSMPDPARLVRSVREQLRQMDILCLPQDGEILIMLPATHEAMAAVVSQRVRDGIAASGPSSLPARVAIGSASFSRDGDVPDQLIGLALARRRIDGPMIEPISAGDSVH